MSELPTGTVTFLLTDIEGSTRLLQERPAEYPLLLERQRALIRAAVASAGGSEFGTEGDAVFAAFRTARDGLEAAVAAQRALTAERWPDDAAVRVRMGLHTGEIALTGGGYVGLEIHRAARVTAAAHGGEVLVSGATRELVGELPEGIALTDLGEHRLKDLARAERLYRVAGDGLPGGFPAPRTLEARPNNLPIQVTSFLGREEMADVRRLLRESRLLTLTGPGGTGKTRLSLQLAAETSDDFEDGVFFVALDSIFDPSLVPSAVMTALGVMPSPDRTPVDALIAHLRSRSALLVLDNFEQVAGAAPFVAELVRGTERLKIVVTSRTPLLVSGEQTYPVRPLPVPAHGAGATAADLARFDSVRLFVERAMAVRPDFKLGDDNAAAVAEIVARVDGLPLAIELAAARVRLLPPDAILTRLGNRLDVLAGGARDLPERQRSLRGAIDWSYDLLPSAERRLFERFSVFAGGAELREAERVCSPDLDLDVLDGLGSLVDASLVRVDGSTGEPRFTMLATIREYAAERLEASPDAAATRRRHAEAYAALAEECQPHVTGVDAPRWLDRLARDHDNVRAALDWAVGADEAGIAMRIGSAVWRFWQVRGHLNEAAERLQRILDLPSATRQPAALRAAAYGAQGSIAYWRADLDVLDAAYDSALRAARESGDQRVLAEAFYNAGFARTVEAAGTDPEIYEAGIEHFQTSVDLWRQLGDARGLANALWALGTGRMFQGLFDEAEPHFLEAEAAYASVGDSFGIGWTFHERGMIDAARGRYGAAHDHFRAATARFLETGDHPAQVLMLADFALVARATGDEQTFWKLAGATRRWAEETGTGLIDTPIQTIPWTVPTEPAAEPAAAASWWAEGQSWNLDEAIEHALERPAAVAASDSGTG